MDLLNKDALAFLVKTMKFNFDKDVIISLNQLDNGNVLSILYSNALAMKNYQTGKLNVQQITKSMEPIAVNSPELKVPLAYLQYLCEQLEQNEGYTKMGYIHSAMTFIEWFGENVKLTKN